MIGLLNYAYGIRARAQQLVAPIELGLLRSKPCMGNIKEELAAGSFC